MAELIGINEASTFWGFCQAHDAKTFAPLETRPILPTDEQAFLLAYRPLVKELYLKEAYFRGLGILRESDRGKGLAAQRSIQERVVLTGAGVNAAIRDLRHHKSNYDRALISRDFAAVRFVAVSLDEVPDILC